MGLGASAMPPWTPPVPLDPEQRRALTFAHELAADYLRDMQAHRPERLAALRNYTKCGLVVVTNGVAEAIDPSRAINRFLAGERTLTLAECDMVRSMLRDVMFALVLAPALQRAHIDVYTGIPHAAYPDPDFGTPMPPTGPAPGDAIGWLRNRIVSASLDPRMALLFAREGCCVFRLRVRPPMRLLPLWTTSDFPMELEVILPPGYQWRAVAKETVGTVEVHHLECTNPGAFDGRATGDLYAETRVALATTLPGTNCGHMRTKAGDIVQPWVGGQHGPVPPLFP